jgi:hypothetical protein
MAGIVRDNVEHHVDDPNYSLLGGDYFSRVPDELDALMRDALHAYAAGDPTWGRQR